MRFGLLINARFIPDGTTVYKPTGDTPYTLLREIKVFYNGVEQVIGNKDNPDFIMLANDRGKIYTYSLDQEMKMYFDKADEAVRWINMLDR